MADTAVAPPAAPKKARKSAALKAAAAATVGAAPKKARKTAAAILAAAHVVTPEAVAAGPAPVALKKKNKKKKKSAKRDERKMDRAITRLQKEGPMLIRPTTFRRCVEAAVRAEAPETLREVRIRLEPASVRLLQHLSEREMGRQLGAVRQVIYRAGHKTIMGKFMDMAAAVGEELRGKK
jgi:hypothetical protein